MTIHATSTTTSYMTAQNAGDKTESNSEFDYPFSTTSFFFLTGMEVRAPKNSFAIAAVGDSITDGVAGTLNESDRWPEVLSRELRPFLGDNVSVVTAAISGNTITRIFPDPFNGGQPLVERLDRDVLDLKGLKTVILLEGINDLGQAGSTAKAPQVIAGIQNVVARLKARGVKVICATILPSLKTAFAQYGTVAVDTERRKVNDFIRTSNIFDGVADFDAVTIDPSTGTLKAEFRPNSTIGGPGDFLHPNRAGYQAMANAVPLFNLLPSSFGVSP